MWIFLRYNFCVFRKFLNLNYPGVHSLWHFIFSFPLFSRLVKTSRTITVYPFSITIQFQCHTSLTPDVRIFTPLSLQLAERLLYVLPVYNFIKIFSIVDALTICVCLCSFSSWSCIVCPMFNFSPPQQSSFPLFIMPWAH